MLSVEGGMTLRLCYPSQQKARLFCIFYVTLH